MTYFQQLQNKHDDPKKAYLEYQLSKKFLRVFASAENIPEDIAISMKIQGQLNEFSQALIDAKNPFSIDSKDYLGIKSMSEIKDFWSKHEDHLDFLSIDRESFISLMSGNYSSNLNTASKNITWDSLESIIIEEKNNIPLMEKDKAIDILQKIIKDYRLVSITLGQCRATEITLEKIGESLSQLSNVVDCDKKQVGSNNFNLFYDCEEFNNAGYSCQFFNIQKLYLNERLSYDAFAHEWLHSIDNMLAKHLKLSNSHASETNLSSIDDLLEASKKINPDVFLEIKSELKEKCFLHLERIVDRYDKVGLIKDPVEFKAFVAKQFEKINTGSWDKQDFIKKCNSYQLGVSACTSYLCSEIELADNMMKKDLDVSVFLKYAQIMDKNLNSLKIMEGDYSTTKLEMFARSFETFTEIKLKEKGLKNIISNSSGNSYTPSEKEMASYIDKWDVVIYDIKKMLNEISPVTKIKNNLDMSKIIGNINSIRASNDNNEVNEVKKIKTGIKG